MKAPGNWRKLEARDQMLSTINSTNPPPPNSTASATESYSSQCRYRKASRPSLFECLGPQKTATVLLNNIYRTPVSGIFRGLWRKPGQRFAVCGGIPAWQMNVSRTIAVKNQGGRRGPARPAGGYELARSRPAERPSYRPIRRKPGAISHPFPLRRGAWRCPP